MNRPHFEGEILELLAAMSPESQITLLEHARRLAAEPTPEQRQAAWQEYFSRPRAFEFDDEFEIAVEEFGYRPVPFWHPHESIY